MKSSMEEHLLMVFKNNIAQKAHIERLEVRIENLEEKRDQPSYNAIFR